LIDIVQGTWAEYETKDPMKIYKDIADRVNTFLKNKGAKGGPLVTESQDPISYRLRRKKGFDFVWDVLGEPDFAVDTGYKYGIQYAKERAHREVKEELRRQYRYRVGELQKELGVNAQRAEYLLNDELEKKMREDPQLMARLQDKVYRSPAKVVGAAFGLLLGGVQQTIMHRGMQVITGESVDEGFFRRAGETISDYSRHIIVGSLTSAIAGVLTTLALRYVSKIMDKYDNINNQESEIIQKVTMKEIAHNIESEKRQGYYPIPSDHEIQQDIKQAMRDPETRREIQQHINHYAMVPEGARTQHHIQQVSKDIADTIYARQAPLGELFNPYTYDPDRPLPSTTPTDVFIVGSLKVVAARLAAHVLLKAMDPILVHHEAKKMLARRLEGNFLRQLQASGVPVWNITSNQREILRQNIEDLVDSPEVLTEIEALKDRVRRDPGFLEKKQNLSFWTKRLSEVILLPHVVGKFWRAWKDPSRTIKKSQRKHFARVIRQHDVITPRSTRYFYHNL